MCYMLCNNFISNFIDFSVDVPPEMPTIPNEMECMYTDEIQDDTSTADPNSDHTSEEGNFPISNCTLQLCSIVIM